MVISNEVAAVIEGPSAAWMATCDRENRPCATPVMGARIDRTRQQLVAYVPVEQAGKTIDNLAVTKQLAIFFCRITDYRAVQVKGPVLEVRAAQDAERELADRYLAAWRETCVAIGLPRAVMEKLANWPALRIELSIAALFDQTPGPRAGVAL